MPLTKAGAGDSHTAPWNEQVVGRHKSTSTGREREREVSLLLQLSFYRLISSSPTRERGREPLNAIRAAAAAHARYTCTTVAAVGRERERESHSNHPPAHSLRSACALPVALSSPLSPLHLSVSFCHVTCPLVGVSQQLVRNTCVWRERERERALLPTPSRLKGTPTLLHLPGGFSR